MLLDVAIQPTCISLSLAKVVRGPYRSCPSKDLCCYMDEFRLLIARDWEDNSYIGYTLNGCHSTLNGCHFLFIPFILSIAIPMICVR